MITRIIKTKSIAPIEPVEGLIQIIRKQRVILDADLARIYGVTTKVLNQSVKRNVQRFPSDFMFVLTRQEVTNLRSQIVTSSSGKMRSQIATGSYGGRRYLPLVFTEHGAIMAANVLNSERAAQMSVFVVRAFVKMRETLAAHHELAQKLKDLEQNLTGQLADHDKILRYVMTELRKLMNPPEPPRKQLGFHVRERRSAYQIRRKKV